MIQIDNLTKKYGDKYVVNNTSWCARDSAITGFIGPNGAGKTTTLKMITGILMPDEGSVRINGIDIHENSVEAKRQFGYVFDSPDHFLRLTATEYLNFICDVYDVDKAERVPFIEEYSKRLGIYESLNKQIMSMSHGMRQKVMVMGALIHKPKVWILDEPLTGLDPQAAYELKKMMREHVEAGGLVLFSTHVLEVAEKLCDEIVIIKLGELKYTGTLDELKDRYPAGTSLESIFLDITGARPEVANE